MQQQGAPHAVGRLCVVGLGLMGGSLALALRAAGWANHIVAVDRDPATIRAALASGAVDEAGDDVPQAVRGADVVVLATPVRSALRLLPEVGRAAAEGTLVLDLCSTKREVCRAMQALPAGLQAVGGHPMCGKETTGFEAADGSLFRDRRFVLCPLERTDARALEVATSLVTAVGARPLLLDPEAHDAAVAAASQLPYLAAVAVVEQVLRFDSLSRELAASGFRDTSRLAGSGVDMMLDILLTNREAVLASLDRYVNGLDELRAYLQAGDEEALRARLAAAREQRIGWNY